MTIDDQVLQLKTIDNYRPAGVHRNLVCQVMTPPPPSGVLFSDEATDKEDHFGILRLD